MALLWILLLENRHPARIAIAAQPFLVLNLFELITIWLNQVPFLLSFESILLYKNLLHTVYIMLKKKKKYCQPLITIVDKYGVSSSNQYNWRIPFIMNKGHVSHLIFSFAEWTNLFSSWFSLSSLRSPILHFQCLKQYQMSLWLGQTFVFIQQNFFKNYSVMVYVQHV